MVWSSAGEPVAGAFRWGRQFCLVVAGVVAVGFGSVGAAVAARWRVQAIPRGAPNLNAVSCSSAKACTAVGDGPEVLRSNGTEWSIQETAKPASASSWSFGGVSCPSATACIAVGSLWIKGVRSVALVERWNGSSWEVQPLPLPGSEPSGLSAVSCTSATACTAVGGYAVLDTGPTPDADSGVSLVERWNGSTWSIQRTPTTLALNGVSCAAPMLCTAVWLNLAGDPVALRWAGRGWSLSKAPSGLGTDFWAVSCPSVKVCTIVGEFNGGSGGGYAVVTEWDGLRWRSPPPAVSNNDAFSFHGVTCTSARACTAVGPDAVAVEWNGSHVSSQDFPNVDWFGGVSCSSRTACVAVGSAYPGDVVERRS